MLVAIFINVKIMWIGSNNGLHQCNASIEDNTCPKKGKLKHNFVTKWALNLHCMFLNFARSSKLKFFWDFSFE